MELNRANPPPTFPISLNKFYYTSPLSWKEHSPKKCTLHSIRHSNITTQVLKKRFPKYPSESPEKHRLSYNSQSVSPRRNYMKPTEEFSHKLRSPSPRIKIRTFFPANSPQGKYLTERISDGFSGSPYEAGKAKTSKEYRDSILKRINGEFKPAYFGKGIEEAPYVTSFNILHDDL
ncbi:unnamed protein product [Blepharisma stoltei]|uniref:Uncharacterized protein n=1 Tax=Blepharisma stoltei TaxID=1481888 RepID=A0AAU9JWP1_9CILI|nr:unnamed protein product [Blepharisma stoltei]